MSRRDRGSVTIHVTWVVAVLCVVAVVMPSMVMRRGGMPVVRTVMSV